MNWKTLDTVSPHLHISFHRTGISLPTHRFRLSLLCPLMITKIGKHYTPSPASLTCGTLVFFQRLNSCLGHAGLRGAASGLATQELDREESRYAKCSKEKPHEDRAGLNLAAPLCVIVGSICDPVPRLVTDVAAVGRTQLGREYDGVHECEEDGQAIES
jgi:hypothetical protein